MSGAANGMVYHADEDEDIEDVDIYHVVRQRLIRLRANAIANCVRT